MMYLQLYQGNISNCNFDRFFVNMWVRSDDCGTHADVGCREIPADCPSCLLYTSDAADELMRV